MLSLITSGGMRGMRKFDSRKKGWKELGQND
jgi:hypothetical protein